MPVVQGVSKCLHLEIHHMRRPSMCGATFCFAMQQCKVFENFCTVLCKLAGKCKVQKLYRIKQTSYIAVGKGGEGRLTPHSFHNAPPLPKYIY